MAVLRDRQLRVPEDVAVVGYNGVLIASRLPVSLSTVVLPLEEMGRLAVDALVGQFEGRIARPVILEPTLQVGASSVRSLRP